MKITIEIARYNELDDAMNLARNIVEDYGRKVEVGTFELSEDREWTPLASVILETEDGPAYASDEWYLSQDDIYQSFLQGEVWMEYYRGLLKRRSELQQRLSELKMLSSPLRMMAHSEDCDDIYQEQLEIRYEIQDVRAELDEVIEEIKQYKD